MRILFMVGGLKWLGKIVVKIKMKFILKLWHNKVAKKNCLTHSTTPQRINLILFSFSIWIASRIDRRKKNLILNYSSNRIIVSKKNREKNKRILEIQIRKYSEPTNKPIKWMLQFERTLEEVCEWINAHA